VSSKQKIRNRRDHYLPQGYLRGFIDPRRADKPKPLWCFHVYTNKWRECSPKQIGYIDGFYDYGTENTIAEHPDITFGPLENDFPRVRSHILENGFPSWTEHKDFLLAYMQMIRARSPLFFEQWREQSKPIRLATITEVLSDKSVRVDSLAGRPMTEGELQNWTIVKMREEIKKGANWLANFHWALRYTESPDNPVITAEQPFVCMGKSTDVSTALQDTETLIYFPLCWQAFLFGSTRRFDVETERFHPETLRRMRRDYIANGRHFLLSPQKLDRF
jgi:hypothetical protein